MSTELILLTVLVIVSVIAVIFVEYIHDKRVRYLKALRYLIGRLESVRDNTKDYKTVCLIDDMLITVDKIVDEDCL